MKNLLALLLFLVSHRLQAQLTGFRAPAEWEETQAVVMEYDIWNPSSKNVNRQAVFEPYLKIARTCIKEQVHFYLFNSFVYNDSTSAVDFDTVFSNYELTSPFIHIVYLDSSISYFPWTRDNGAQSVYKNQTGELCLTGYTADGVAPYMANLLGTTYLQLTPSDTSRFYFEGGNFLTDGFGLQLANYSPELDTQNSYSHNPDNLFRDTFGIERQAHFKGLGIHVDYWLKLLNEETILIAEMPLSETVSADDSAVLYQAMLNDATTFIQKNLTNVCGAPFKIVRVQNASSVLDTSIHLSFKSFFAGYANSIIINKTIAVPQYGVEPFDSQALQKISDAMPGYTVMGVNTSQYANAEGSIHCLTHQVAAPQSILIKHCRLADTVSAQKPILVTAEIKTPTGVRAAKIFYRTDKGKWNMVKTKPGQQELFSVYIPAQPINSTLEYYMQVKARSGKKIIKPMVALQGGAWRVVVN